MATDGRSTRWGPHRRERRAAIIAAALTAIESSGPRVHTAQIAAAAGVPRTHVYRHFDGKSALELAVSRQVAVEIGKRVRAGLARRGSPRTMITAAISEHLGWIEAHPNLYRFLAQHAYAVARTGETAVDDAKAVIAAELTALLQGYLSVLGADPTPAARVAVGVVGMVDATAAWWLEHRDVPRAELTAALAEQVWLVIDHAARGLGLCLDPDLPLPPLPDPD